MSRLDKSGSRRQSDRRSVGSMRKDGRGPAPVRRLPPKPSAWQAGEIVSLHVARKVDFGYFLSAGEDEILLHTNEASRTLSEGEQVEVFLYHDHENRLAATMQMPLVKMGEFGWLRVVSVSPRMGVFLHNGIHKDLLLFVDDLPKLHDEWPQVGDRLLTSLKRDKHGRLLAQPVTEQEILAFSHKADKEMLNQWVEGTVYKVIGTGAFVFTESEHVLYIHRDEMTERLRMGQDVYCRVSYVREDGRLNGSMKARKEQRYGEDASQLLKFMMDRGGSMPYTDHTEPDVIREKFAMSKAAFKRAMGKLLKEGIVEQEQGWTHVKQEVYRSRQQENE